MQEGGEGAGLERQHHLPPQARAWMENSASSPSAKGGMKVHRLGASPKPSATHTHLPQPETTLMVTLYLKFYLQNVHSLSG